jgi:uncharacterized protein (DUF488 family)
LAVKALPADAKRSLPKPARAEKAGAGGLHRREVKHYLKGRVRQMDVVDQAGRARRAAARIVTVGHSNRTLREFLELLRTFGVRRLVDVRTIPKSRAVPQFNEARLRAALKRADIEYTLIPQLGGLRRNSPDPSPRPCWRNRGFRNYADHMRTADFREGVRALLAESRRGRTAVMCAEAVPWRCHRSLIADYLVVEKKHAVEELVGDRARPHRLSVCARVVRGRLTYDLPRRS